MDDERIVSQQPDAMIDGAIQPGAIVLGSDGNEVGAVVSVTPQAMIVKKRGFFGGQVEIPRSLVRQAEEGHVELEVPAKQASSR